MSPSNVYGAGPASCWRVSARTAHSGSFQAGLATSGKGERTFATGWLDIQLLSRPQFVAEPMEQDRVSDYIRSAVKYYGDDNFSSQHGLSLDNREIREHGAT